MPQLSGFFFRPVIQAILIFVAETWVVTPCMGTAMEGSQTQMAIRMTGHILRRTTDGMCKYTLVAAAMEAAGFLTMEENVRRRQNTVAQYIATRSLLDLCEGLERDPGARLEI